MKKYIKPNTDVFEIEAEGAFMAESDNRPNTDNAGFGEPTDEMD